MNTKFSGHWGFDSLCFMVFFTWVMIAGLIFIGSAELVLFSHSEPGDYFHSWVAPIVEESVKLLMLGISIPFGIAFTGIFALVEALNYSIYAIDHFPDLLPAFFIVRIICIGVHFLTLSCQIYGFKMYYKYKMWVYLLAGYGSAMFIHFEWNVEVGRYVSSGVFYLYDISIKLLGGT